MVLSGKLSADSKVGVKAILLTSTLLDSLWLQCHPNPFVVILAFLVLLITFMVFVVYSGRQTQITTYFQNRIFSEFFSIPVLLKKAFQLKQTMEKV